MIDKSEIGRNIKKLLEGYVEKGRELEITLRPPDYADVFIDREYFNTYCIKTKNFLSNIRADKETDDEFNITVRIMRDNLLDNYGEYKGAELQLPASVYEIKDAFQRARIKDDIFAISDFLDFMGDNLWVDYNAATRYKAYLDSLGLSEVTLHGKWSSVNKFLEIMNGYEGYRFKMVFAENPYDSHKKHDYKYIPDNVAEQLDNVFYNADVDQTVRCIYWVLRLIPSRISAVLNMKIDCLKPYNGHYCLFIPSWKQNGGRKEPIMRCIHIENEGMGRYLISLIKKQQQMADEFQKYMPEISKGALFTYRIINHMPDGTENLTNQYRVIKWPTISEKLSAICKRYNIIDEHGNVYKVTTHQFRHNGITDRLAKGFTVEQITDMTGHHGGTMLLDAYAHLNLKPETITKVQNSVIDEIERDYSAFNGHVLDMDEATEKEIMKNVRAHRVRGGICSNITGCKSDMMNCLECKLFLPDPNQMEYYMEQIELWQQKAEKFKSIPLIRANATKNVELYRNIIDKLEKYYL